MALREPVRIYEQQLANMEAQQKKVRRGWRVDSGSGMEPGEFIAVKMTENVAAVGMLEKSPELW